MDYKTKLEGELKALDKKLSRIEVAMAEPVCRMLISFGEKDQRFADAVFAKTETLSDCMRAVGKGVQYSISDVEAYRRAVQFYFPAADVDFKCVVVLPAEKKGIVTRGIGTASESEEITVSLFDLF